jgi:hypothetical protein
LASIINHHESIISFNLTPLIAKGSALS